MARATIEGMKVIACLAASLDGKISTRDTLDNPNSHIRIGSDADLQHLLAVRDQCDAVLMGAGTFRAYARPRRDSQNNAPLHAIVTHSGNLRPGSTYFKNQPAISTVVYSPQSIKQETQCQYPETIHWVTTGSDNPVAIILEDLSRRGVNTLLVEGGGEIVDLFLRARALDELILTICPLLLGGRDVPGLLTGEGFYLKEAPRSKILSMKRVEDELYLHLALQYPQAGA